MKRYEVKRYYWVRVCESWEVEARSPEDAEARYHLDGNLVADEPTEDIDDEPRVEVTELD